MSADSQGRRFQSSNGRPTWAEINLSALAGNFRDIKDRVAPEIGVMAVVKADAYGHGAIPCARRLADEGADWFGVALPEEGVQLRSAGITQPILCLGGFWEGQAALCLQYGLVPAVFRLDLLEELDRAAKQSGTTADVHLKVDTGMGRLGVRFDQVPEFIKALTKFEHLRLDGLMTHFAAADDPSCRTLTDQQLQRFREVLALVRARGYEPTYRHLANSAAIFGEPGAWGNLVRPGGILYGLWRDILPPATEVNVRPVMSLHSKIVLLKWVPAGETLGYGCTFEASRRTLVATIPIGYEDGYLRGLSNRGHVLVRNTYAPVVGRISMDLTLIDVTNVPEVSLGDEVVLMGQVKDQANNVLEIPAEDLARVAGTLSYEVTCGISERVPRVYT